MLSSSFSLLPRFGNFAHPNIPYSQLTQTNELTVFMRPSQCLVPPSHIFMSQVDAPCIQGLMGVGSIRVHTVKVLWEAYTVRQVVLGCLYFPFHSFLSHPYGLLAAYMT